MYITTYKESVHYLRRGGGSQDLTLQIEGEGAKNVLAMLNQGGGTTSFKVFFTLSLGGGRCKKNLNCNFPFFLASLSIINDQSDIKISGVGYICVT